MIKKLRVVIILAAVLAVAMPVQAENPGADYLVKIAKRELDKGNIKDAVHEFSKALLLEPGNEEAHRYLAQLGYPGGLYPKGKGARSQDQQITAGQWYGSVDPHERDFERWKRQQHARKVFRSERIRYEHNKDRASYLRDYPQVGQNGIRHVSDSVSMTTIGAHHYGQDVSTHSPRPFTDRQLLIERYLDVHEPAVHATTDQYRFPNRQFQDQEKETYPQQPLTEFYDLQGMLDFSRDNELAFFYWLDDEPKSSYEIQFEHQDDLITVLDEYLQVREAQLQNHEDRILDTELALLQTQTDLVAQVQANDDLHEVYQHVVKMGDDHAFYVMQENEYMEFLESKIKDVRSQLSNRTQEMQQTESQLVLLQQELDHYRRQVDELLTEREELLTDVTQRVDELQRIGDLNVRP